MEWSYSGFKSFRRIEESRALPLEGDLEGLGLGGDEKLALLLSSVEAVPEDEDYSKF